MFFWSNERNFFLNTNKGLEIRGSIGGLENLRALLLHAKGELPPSPRLRRTSRRAGRKSSTILCGSEINLPYYVSHRRNFLLRRGFGGQVEGLEERVQLFYAGLKSTCRFWRSIFRTATRRWVPARKVLPERRPRRERWAALKVKKSSLIEQT